MNQKRVACFAALYFFLLCIPFLHLFHALTYRRLVFLLLCILVLLTMACLEIRKDVQWWWYGVLGGFFVLALLVIILNRSLFFYFVYHSRYNEHVLQDDYRKMYFKTNIYMETIPLKNHVNGIRIVKTSSWR